MMKITVYDVHFQPTFNQAFLVILTRIYGWISWDRDPAELKQTILLFFIELSDDKCSISDFLLVVFT